MSRSAWRDSRASSTAGELAGLSGYLEADDEQRGGPGPVVTIAIENAGPADVSLVNPFDMIQLLVTDAEGYPLPVPQTAPSLLTGWRGLDLALPVVALTRDGDEVDLAAVDSEVMTIPAGSGYAISLAIDRLQDGPAGAGIYDVGCTLNLIAGSDRTLFRTVRAGPVRIAFI